MKLSDEAMDTGMGDLARSEITEVRVILGRRLREGGRGGEGRKEGFYFHSILYAVLIL